MFLKGNITRNSRKSCVGGRLYRRHIHAKLIGGSGDHEDCESSRKLYKPRKLFTPAEACRESKTPVKYLLDVRPQ